MIPDNTNVVLSTAYTTLLLLEAEKDDIGKFVTGVPPCDAAINGGADEEG
jgi:hypothetical protein